MFIVPYSVSHCVYLSALKYIDEGLRRLHSTKDDLHSVSVLNCLGEGLGRLLSTKDDIYSAVSHTQGKSAQVHKVKQAQPATLVVFSCCRNFIYSKLRLYWAFSITKKDNHNIEI